MEEPILTVFAQQGNTYFAFHFSSDPQNTQLLDFVCHCFNALINHGIVTDTKAELYCFCDSDLGYLVCRAIRSLDGAIQPELSVAQIKDKFNTAIPLQEFYCLKSRGYNPRYPISLYKIHLPDTVPHITSIINNSTNFSKYDIYTSKLNCI